MESALEIRNLNVSYNSIKAVRGVSLTLERGTITALIGESGAGKSTVASAIIGLLPRNATAEGEIIYKGQNLLGSDEKTLRCIRKKSIALIPQSHMAALEPMNKAVSILKWKTAHSNQKDKSYINAVLASAGIDNPERILSSYPEDLSGGTRQRILIASALASDTDIIIADEMTSALDAPLRKEMSSLLVFLAKEKGITVLMITHDIEMAISFSDSIAVMKDGIITEYGPREKIAAKPSDAYTRDLILSHFSRTNNKEKQQSIILRASDISKRYSSIEAISSLSLTLSQGEILGIAGASGAGKTTLLRILSSLEAPDSGTVTAERKTMMVFQDSYHSLDGTMNVITLVSEPMIIRGIKKKEAREKATHFLHLSHVDESLFLKYPASLSGGERARVQIARALAADAQILLLDEPFSSLDRISTSQILTTLSSLRDNGTSMIIVSHDASFLLDAADRMIIMKDGAKIKEGTPSEMRASSDPYISFLLHS